MREEFGTCVQRQAEDEKAVVNQQKPQGDGDPHVGFFPVRPDSKRDADQGERDAGEGEGELAMDLDVDGCGGAEPGAGGMGQGAELLPPCAAFLQKLREAHVFDTDA